MIKHIGMLFPTGESSPTEWTENSPETGGALELLCVGFSSVACVYAYRAVAAAAIWM